MNINITTSLVTNLIATQFPEWANLPITPVPISGWDNRTFRLGETMLVRLPSAEKYAAKVLIEQKWLPILAQHLSIPIPHPIAMGQPSQEYPWHWSVYAWLEGTSTNMLHIDKNSLQNIAKQLAEFLNELYAIDATNSYFTFLIVFSNVSHS